nr:MAG TPA: hypothetical protein [Caudoviricetes sp.]
MIKLKKSKSKYTQYYKQYQRKVSALRKQNIELRGANVYQTESQLRKWGIQGRDLAKITRQLKTDIKNLAKQAAYSTETGEISTVGELKHELASERAKRGAVTRKRNKQSAREFWSTDKTPTTHDLKDELHLRQPQLGDISNQHFVDDFLIRITTPVPTETIYGNRRKRANIEMAQEAQSALLELYRSTIDKDGEIVVGERLANNWDTIKLHLEVVLTDSKGVNVASSLEAIGEIISGRTLSVVERDALNNEQESLYSWDIEDNTYE